MIIIKFWEVTTHIYGNGIITATLTNVKESDIRPKDTMKKLPQFDVWTDWFESEDIANKYITKIRRM